MPRLGRGALTFRGTLAGRGRLDMQGGEPTFWKLPGPPQLLVHPALTRPRHAAFPEPRANVSLLQPRLPSPLIPWKAGWRDEGLRGGSPAGKGARAGKEAGSWLWLPIQGEAWASGPPGLRASGPPGPAASSLTPGWAPPQHSCRAHGLSSPRPPHARWSFSRL